MKTGRIGGGLEWRDALKKAKSMNKRKDLWEILIGAGAGLAIAGAACVPFWSYHNKERAIQEQEAADQKRLADYEHAQETARWKAFDEQHERIRAEQDRLDAEHLSNTYLGR